MDYPSEGRNTNNNTFVDMLNKKVKRKTILEVELTKENYKQVLNLENEKTKSLQEELKNVERENEALKKELQEYKVEIEKNKIDYTGQIYNIRNNLRQETNKLSLLNQDVADLDSINKEHAADMEKIRVNIASEMRKRQIIEQKVEAKNLEMVKCEKEVEALKAKQNSIKCDIREINEKIEDAMNVSDMFEEKYKSTVNSGRDSSNTYKKLEMKSKLIEKEKDTLVELLKWHQAINSKLSEMIIENINPCVQRTMLNELSEMMSEIDKQNNRHEQTMEEIRYEREIRTKDDDKQDYQDLGTNNNMKIGKF